MLTKESALRFAKRSTPLYSKLFQELRAEGGRVRISKRYAKHRQDLGTTYVLLYDDERKAGVAIMLALLGEEGVKKLNDDAASWSEKEISDFVEEIGSDEGQETLLEGFTFPVTEKEWKEHDERYLALPEDEQVAALKASALLFSGVFAQIFNTLALMTHGAALTTLVPKAIEGVDEAFLKAVQVDRLLLTHHPYFIARKQRAQDEGDTEFLSALAYRDSNPNLKGKIRYPALFMLFGLLESVKWLDKLKHDEITSLMARDGITDFLEGAARFVMGVQDHFQKREELAETYVARKVRLKARQFGTLNNRQDYFQDKERVRQAARTYSKAKEESDG